MEIKELKIEEFINKKLAKDEYYKLVNLYGKEKLSNLINKYLKIELEKDFSRENQTRLWEMFGYYLACQESNVFEEVAIARVKTRNSRSRPFTLQEEKKYGYQLLIRPCIELFDKDGNISIKQILASIDDVEARDYVLEKFDYMYRNISRVSYFDIYVKNFLADYKRRCLDENLPWIDYDGVRIKKEELLDQVDMYVRYSIAVDKMLIGNLALVERQASSIEGYEYDELYQSGYFGLRRAVLNFDVRYDQSFITFVGKWINSYIYKDIWFEAFSAKIAFLSQVLIKKVGKRETSFRLKYGRSPSELELATLSNISVEELKEIKLWEYQFEKLSLNQYIDNDSEGWYSLEEIVADTRVDYISKIDNHDLYEHVLKIMDKKLPERERDILLKRASGLTLDQVGYEYGISYERVRQLEERAIKKLQPSLKKNKIK